MYKEQNTAYFLNVLSMILCMIVAFSSNYVIGKENKLPRHYPDDLKRFKDLTYGSAIVMGRATYESIGKPLPHRRNIVISRTESFDDVECFTDPEHAIAVLEEELGEHDKVFIIGGATLYNYFLEQTEWLYVTEIKKIYAGDTFFPAFEEHFEEVERISHDDHDFVTYRKRWVE